MPLRLCKIAVVSCSFFYLLLVVFGNLTDYDSNYQFVRHVLSMDTTFPGNLGMWRSMTSPWIHRIFYAGIILWEAITCAVIGAGTVRLWRSRAAEASAWKEAKTLAAVGLVLSMLQWFLGFTTIGGEWFLMWQSKAWNGLDPAFRMFATMGISLIFLCMSDEDQKRP